MAFRLFWSCQRALIGSERSFDQDAGFTGAELVQTDIEIKSCSHGTLLSYFPLRSVEADYSPRTNLPRLAAPVTAFTFT